MDSNKVLLTSVLSFFEVERRLRALNYSQDQIAEFLDFMDLRCTTLFLDRVTIAFSVRLSLQHKLGTVDSILLASAQLQDTIFVTGDYDFHAIHGVEIIEK